MAERNPDWTTEELILGLETWLAITNDEGSGEAALERLSEELRALPIHAPATRTASFRNVAGVRRRLQHFRVLATGAQLPVPDSYRRIWEQWSDQPATLQHEAQRIRRKYRLPTITPLQASRLQRVPLAAREVAMTKGYKGQTCAEALKNCFVGREVLSASVLFSCVRAQGEWTDETIWQHLMARVVNLPPARHHWATSEPFLFLRPDGQYEIWNAERHPSVIE